VFADRCHTVKRALALFAAFSFVLTVALPAGAHTAIGSGGYYNRRWKIDLHLPWYFANTFPGGAYRDKIVYGVGQWNAQNQPLYWTKYGDVADFTWTSCPATFERNVIHFQNADKPGYVKVCVWAADTNRIWSTNMNIDSSGTNWYTGSSEPASNQIDLWSVATHEWGHMSGSVTGGGDGLGHFPESSTVCPTDASRQSLCPTIYAGTTWMWDTESHDEHTFQAAY
jgi:hypothetical protein